MTDSTPARTVRSRTICECAALRHQLRLADELAKEVKAVLDDCPTWDLVALRRPFTSYSEARIQAEVTTPNVEEQVERR